MNPNATWDYPTSPIYQWPENQPPFTPNVQVAPEIYPMIPQLAAKIANMAGVLAPTTPVRMFCYNTLSTNNWANEAYASVIKLVADLIITQQEHPDRIISDVLSCYSSALAANNTMLYNSLPPGMKVAIGDNYRTYNDMLKLTASVSQPRSQRVAQHGAQPYQQTRPTLQPRQPQGNRTSQSAINTNTFSGQPAPRVFTAKPAETVKNVITRPIARSPQPIPVKNEVESNTVQGEKEMDRNKHALVYGGVIFPGANIEQKASLERIEEAIAQVKDPTVAEIRNLEPSYDLSVTGAIVDAISEALGGEDGKGKIIPKLMNHINPVMAMVDLSLIAGKMHEQFTFSDLARLIITFIQETAKDDPELRRNHYAWAAQVDRVMTELINSWLRGTFNNKITIDSFLYDAGDLPGVISTKYDQAGVRAFNRFQNSLMSQQSKGDNADLEFLKDSGIKDYTAFIVPYMLFITTETAASLNYDITPKLKRVVRESTSRLYQLLSNLSRIANARHTVRNVLVTVDGHRYEFFESGLGEDAFHIVEI